MHKPCLTTLRRQSLNINICKHHLKSRLKFRVGFSSLGGIGLMLFCAAMAPSAAPGCRPQHMSGGLKRNLNTELLRTLSLYLILIPGGSGFKALKSQGLELRGFRGLVFSFRIWGFRVTGILSKWREESTVAIKKGFPTDPHS